MSVRILHPAELPRSAVLGYLAAMRAVIDIGSNSVLLLVGERRANGSLAIVLDPGGAPIALQKYPF